MQLTQEEITILITIRYELDTCRKSPPGKEELVRRYAIKESKLIRGFKFLFQVSIYQYWLENVMRYAKSRLESGVPVKVIAVELGYSSSRNFSRAYRSVYGHTPRAIFRCNDAAADVTQIET